MFYYLLLLLNQILYEELNYKIIVHDFAVV